MNQNYFLIIYLALLAGEFITLFTLTVLNINSVLRNKNSIPELFKTIITEDMYKKSVNYTIKKEHFSIFNLVFTTILTALILLSGFLGSIEELIMNYFTNKIIVGLVFLGVVSSIIGLINLPISLYSTFVIEEEFGFNKMNIKTYITDTIKEVILTTILGAFIVTILFIFMDKTGSFWWIWATIFYISFQLLMVLIYPNFIAPIFNKFTPLEDGELKEKLENMAKKAQFSLSGIFVMDGSKRSGHSNAYFTGIGKTKRIVLYDTLIKNLSTPELCGVLAHEIGHWKKGHIKTTLLKTFLVVPVVFFILSIIINFPVLFTTFNMEIGTYHGLIILISLISSPFTFYFKPLSNRSSRKHEFEADAYAKELTGEGESLISALLKLSKDNLSNITPDANYSNFHYSHPPVNERVEKLQSLKS